jgi:hypothetical protein
MQRFISYNKETGMYYVPDNVDNTAITTKSKRKAIAAYFKFGAKQCVYDTGCVPSMTDLQMAIQAPEFTDVFGEITEDEFDTALMDMFE